MARRIPGRKAGLDAADASPFPGSAAALPFGFPVNSKHGRPIPGALRLAFRIAVPPRHGTESAPAAPAF